MLGHPVYVTLLNEFKLDSDVWEVQSKFLQEQKTIDINLRLLEKEVNPFFHTSCIDIQKIIKKKKQKNRNSERIERKEIEIKKKEIEIERKR